MLEETKPYVSYTRESTEWLTNDLLCIFWFLKLPKQPRVTYPISAVNPKKLTIVPIRASVFEEVCIRYDFLNTMNTLICVPWIMRRRYEIVLSLWCCQNFSVLWDNDLSRKSEDLRQAVVRINRSSDGIYAKKWNNTRRLYLTHNFIGLENNGSGHKFMPTVKYNCCTCFVRKHCIYRSSVYCYAIPLGARCYNTTLLIPCEVIPTCNRSYMQ